MNRIRRRRALVTALRQQPWARTRNLAESLGVSVRTIRRDIAALRKQGVPVEGHRGKGMRLGTAFVLEAVSFTRDEAALMAVGSAIVAERLDPDLRAAARAARERLMEAGGNRLAADVSTLEVSLRLAPGGMEAAAYEHEVFELLRQALVSQTAVRFATERGETPHTFLPYGLTRIRGWWHAVGFCRARGLVCDYSLRAMQDLALTEEAFTRPRGYTEDVDEPTKERPATARVQFDAFSSQWIVAAAPSFVKAIRKKGEGIVVTLEQVPDPALFAWILGWGAHARVLSPVSLLQRVAAEAAKIVDQYVRAGNGRKWQPTLF